MCVWYGESGSAGVLDKGLTFIDTFTPFKSHIWTFAAYALCSPYRSCFLKSPGWKSFLAVNAAPSCVTHGETETQENIQRNVLEREKLVLYSSILQLTLDLICLQHHESQCRKWSDSETDWQPHILQLTRCGIVSPVSFFSIAFACARAHVGVCGGAS